MEQASHKSWAPITKSWMFFMLNDLPQAHQAGCICSINYVNFTCHITTQITLFHFAWMKHLHHVHWICGALCPLWICTAEASNWLYSPGLKIVEQKLQISCANWSFDASSHQPTVWRAEELRLHNDTMNKRTLERLTVDSISVCCEQILQGRNSEFMRRRLFAVGDCSRKGMDKTPPSLNSRWIAYSRHMWGVLEDLVLFEKTPHSMQLFSHIQKNTSYALQIWRQYFHLLEYMPITMATVCLEKFLRVQVPLGFIKTAS